MNPLLSLVIANGWRPPCDPKPLYYKSERKTFGWWHRDQLIELERFYVGTGPIDGGKESSVEWIPLLTEAIFLIIYITHRDRQRYAGRQRQVGRDWQIKTERQTDRARQTETDGQRETEADTVRERDRKTDRTWYRRIEKQTNGNTQRQADGHRRQKQTDRDIQTDWCKPKKNWPKCGWQHIASFSISMWRACNLTSFTPCLTGPVDYPFASHHEGPWFKPQGDTYVKPGFSC
jgi:hypothetical protein